MNNRVIILTGGRAWVGELDSFSPTSIRQRVFLPPD